MKRRDIRNFLLIPILSFFTFFPDLSACTSFDLDYTFTCAAAGDMITVTWTSSGCAGGEMVDISLIDVTANAIAQYYPGTANSGSLTITLGAGLAPGPYQMYVQYAPSWPPDAWDYGLEFTVKAAAPVQWGDFESRADNNKVDLSWSTFSEVNNDGFEVQHSRDGSSWEALGFVEGQGNSSLENHYAYVHTNPSSDINYYRLKQMDYNGSSDYSQINMVNLNRGKNLKVYPTIVEQTFTIDLGSEIDSEVVIRDIQGQTLISKQLDGIRQIHSIDISQLPSNVLFVSVDINGKTITKKIVKQ